MDLTFPTTAKKIADLFGAPVWGDENAVIEKVSALPDTSLGSLTFFGEEKYRNNVKKLTAGVVFSTEKLAEKNLGVTFIIVDDPKVAFASVAKNFIPKCPWNDISQSATIHLKARLGKNVRVGPFAVICEGAEIGDNSVIYPNAYIGPEVVIGESCEIHPNVTLLANVRLGNRVKIFSGSVLGSEGFGLLQSDTGHKEVPQIGWVIVEDDVRIGAKCTVDRSTLGETRIGRGCKLDDQVHVGHNCVLGENVILCAQVGLAGSSTLEDGVICGGQVGISDHVRVGKKAMLGGKAGVGSDIDGGQAYMGAPTIPLKDFYKLQIFFKKLPDLFDRVKKLEKSTT